MSLITFLQPVGTEAKNFNYESGDYNLELIVGDAVLSNSFEWNLGSVHLKFPDIQNSEIAEKSSYRQKPNVYTPKPEIKVFIFLCFFFLIKVN